MAPTESHQWVLAKKPVDLPELSGPNATFIPITKSLPAVQDNQILIKVLDISNDPAQRGWIGANVNPERLYTTPVNEGDLMRAFVIARVEESKAADYPVGSFVQGELGWTDYAVVDANKFRQIQKIGDLPLTHYLGAFGGTGLTAYYGTKEIGGLQAGETLVVSGAAGATGSMVVQIAKNLLGAKKVIGIAGGDAKCKWVESLGADVCVNYKKDSFKEDLAKATEGFADVYFDNVGGEILDFMLTRMKRHGRVVACGAVADYNSGKPKGITNWFDIITMRLQVRGFIVIDALAAGKAPEYLGALIQGYKEGKIKLSDDAQTVVPTKFEDIPKTWMMLFSGGNQGKLVTELV